MYARDKGSVKKYACVQGGEDCQILEIFAYVLCERPLGLNNLGDLKVTIYWWSIEFIGHLLVVNILEYFAEFVE